MPLRLALPVRAAPWRRYGLRRFGRLFRLRRGTGLDDGNDLVDLDFVALGSLRSQDARLGRIDFR